jgi:polyhydroxyalkanoate synthesis regulator phasin
MAGFDVTEIPYLVLGTVAAAREESVKMAKDLVDKGKGIAPATKARAKDGAKAKDALIARAKDGAKAKDALVAKGTQRSDEVTEAVVKSVQRLLSQMGLGTKADIDSLEKRLAALEKKTEKPAARKPAKKPAARKPAKKPAARK